MTGEYEMMTSTYLSLTDNRKLKRFTLGYGINYSINKWEYIYNASFDAPPPSRDPVTKSSQSFGFVVDGYYQFGKHFFMGLIYRPTLLNIQPKTEFKYEHVISLDFVWKIRIKK